MLAKLRALWILRLRSDARNNASWGKEREELYTCNIASPVDMPELD